jgi:two-component system, chemotaxis family, protein-glutamate methylesterase/glutaminase
MIVDDSPVARAVLSRMISSFPEFEVVALAADAREALDSLKSIIVDVVLLDVEMPGTSGIEALPDILEKGRGAQVLIVSSICEDGAAATVKALALGAADTLPKPGTGNFGGRFAEVLAERLRKIGRARGELEEAVERGNPYGSIQLRDLPVERLECLALGASTGGLHSLTDFFTALPTRIGSPILITQHLPSVFMPYFARQIEGVSGRKAHVARDGLKVRAEEVIVAPGDAHLGLQRSGNAVTVQLVNSPASSGCMPSVDTMLAAVADAYGKHGLAVIFSGMGRDGLVGSSRLIDRGGAALVQDQETCAVWGMPRVVAEAGLASAILPPGELAGCVAAIAHGVPWK